VADERVAADLDIPILRLEVDDDAPAGQFRLSGEALGDAGAAGPAGPDDIALVLHTSGTTSRPKIVPLTQANLAASAQNIRATLALTAADRCLNIMPLFHIHGLIAAVLSSLSAGASVVCTPGFNALRFFGWLEEAKPSWYTAVPTMHQAILSRAGRNAESIAAAKLRFIRSSSSSLPPQVMAELEEAFGCPVLESYGMTEASHQMASNPLPPGARKPGCVGPAAGPEMAIMATDGSLLGPDAVGEIVIRGPNVTSGYENNPKANVEAFAHGWFHTGDQGTMDADGYFRITGRLKEIINRGGEKISPREVDEVLMDHPAVGQVVTFAMPHDKLGEEVAAAIVLREGHNATEREIRDFAASRLADFKVPRRLVFLEEIPKGATGKLQRIGLAEKLGLTG
jgi:oxalate---CoA ligase